MAQGSMQQTKDLSDSQQNTHLARRKQYVNNLAQNGLMHASGLSNLLAFPATLFNLGGSEDFCFSYPLSLKR